MGKNQHVVKKNGYGQSGPIRSLEEAKEIGKIMLYTSRRINKLEH